MKERGEVKDIWCIGYDLLFLPGDGDGDGARDREGKSQGDGRSEGKE